VNTTGGSAEAAGGGLDLWREFDLSRRPACS